ncbi:unnamed protein product [Oikopleura dioica]|uniref:Uncharacterized protein n=1 Tax=Oikopleura dioica TaxID=34765 RepID=E4XXM9_OIKDI|nr:unnamed protein product [Oikopleura dioica]
MVDAMSDYSKYDRRLSTSYLSDGSRKTKLYMKTPFDGSFLRVGFTMLYGEYYVFGGFTSTRNIFKFNGCALEQLEATMPTQRYAGGAEVRTVLHADGSENAYICFTNGYENNNRKCDSFDGTTAVSQPYVSSAASRQDSSMANYKGGLLVFGGWSYADGTSTTLANTEYFTPEVGFSAAQPMITATNRMNSLSIGSDRVIMFGGYLDGEGITNKIYTFFNDEWSFAGNMVAANSRTTAIMIGSSIIVSSGQQSGVIQQFEWDGDSISEGRIVDDIGDYRQLMSPIVIPELFEECERPTNEFIFGAALKVTDNEYEFTALDLSLSTGDYFQTSPEYFKDAIYEMDSYAFAPGIVSYKGQIYMMGGVGSQFWTIWKFTGSTTEKVELSGEPYTGYGRLYGNNPVVGWQDNQERVFLCFMSYNSKKTCQTFDGSVIRNIDSEAVYEHDQGCVGTFERNKEVVAIGGQNSAGITEIFDGTSWRDGPNQPNNLRTNAVAVDVGAGIITIGGFGDLSGYRPAFRFGEIIVAHIGNGINMLTWNGDSLEDHGMQIDFGRYGLDKGVFIPKEDAKIDLFPLAILSDLQDSYSTVIDGSTVSANIIAPSNEYTYGSTSAMVNGRLYIFGGLSDQKKIARLDGCEFIELAAKLNEDFLASGAAISAYSGTRALICFGPDTGASCQLFDGANSVPTFSTAINHQYGGLGMYRGQPTTVGAFGTYPDYLRNGKAETLTSSGWTALPDFSDNAHHHALVELENGNMLLIGGFKFSTQLSNIWELNEEWTKIGNLQSVFGAGSAIRIGKSIFVVPGVVESSGVGGDVQRIDLTAEEEIESVEIIGTHTESYTYPILLATSNTCHQ